MPVIRNPELIGPALQDTLDKLIDDDCRQVMGQLRKMSDYELTRESNITWNHTIGRALGLIDPLKVSNIFTGMHKKPVEPLSDDESDLNLHLATKEKHLLEAEHLRIEVKEAAMLFALNTDAAADNNNNGTMMQGINQTMPSQNVYQSTSHVNQREK